GKGNIEIDWRIPGGTSEITRLLSADFRAGFKNYWRNELGNEWDSTIAGAFNDRKRKLPEDPADYTTGDQARHRFLSSNVGIGIDVFFGGGTYDFIRQAEHGHLVALDTKQTRYGPGIISRDHRDWFSEDVIPATVSGETYYDSQFRWIGTCLSSFGIVYNTDSLERLGISKAPQTWDDLGSHLYARQVALADPTKSGSITKAFEMLIQEKIQTAIANAERFPGQSDEQVVQHAIERGWIDGLQLIQKISANARYFTDDATKIPRDVSSGVSAAGMCIDFYGRTQSEYVRRPDGTSRVGYTTPVGGSSTSVDPIALLRGAPNPEHAHDFIEFVLSEEGQKLWNTRVGAPGGPEHSALRRLPVRKDVYTSENLAHFSDAAVMPYEHAGAFVYKPEYTASAFQSIRFIVRVMCLDTHDELKEAWHTLIKMDFPPRATQLFHDVHLVNYPAATGRIAEILSQKGDPLLEVHLARNLADEFRVHYETAIEMALRGE
ncbi:MAG: extracellular solute-binding protein, partial [Verrucomicrobiales bacterium]|nr:extracellular solute-binding protein [Verrucomicrobiales bacterium]